MHYIQRSILGRLMADEAVRYRDLKPFEVASNLFTYHLKVLVSEGYVVSSLKGTYQLTTKGQRFVGAQSISTLQPHLQPKLVILLACRDRLGRWLVMKRRTQPLSGKVGFPYGKLHLGEKIAEAATRELTEKTGLSGELVHRGDGYITILEKHTPISEIFFHLYYCLEPTGYLVGETRTGQVYWSEMEVDFQEDQYMPSMAELIAVLDNTPSDQRFFIESSYTIA